MPSFSKECLGGFVGFQWVTIDPNVKAPPPKGGGFGLRLKAGSVGPMGRLVRVLPVSAGCPSLTGLRGPVPYPPEVKC